MAGPTLVDHIWVLSTTTGTGDYTISSTAKTGFRTLAEAATAGLISNGDVLMVGVHDLTNGGFEDGFYTWNSGPNTLSRTTINHSSNSNAAVNWPAGTRDIVVSVPASWEMSPTHTAAKVLFARSFR